VPEPDPRVSVHPGPAHSDWARHDPAKAARHGKRTTAPHVLQLDLPNGRRAPNSVRQSLDQLRRVRVDQQENLTGLAVQIAAAPSRRSPGRNPIPIAPPSSPTPARAEMPSLIVKKSKRPDRPGYRLKQ
jgi:hypothetical protein